MMAFGYNPDVIWQGHDALLQTGATVEVILASPDSNFDYLNGLIEEQIGTMGLFLSTDSGRETYWDFIETYFSGEKPADVTGSSIQLYTEYLNHVHPRGLPFGSFFWITENYQT